MLWFIETCKHVWKQKLSLYIYFQDNSEKLQEAEPVFLQTDTTIKNKQLKSQNFRRYGTTSQTV